MKNLICIFSILFFISCGTSQEIKAISTSKLKTILKTDKIQLLDVRTAEETKHGFIETALFVDVKKDDFFEKASAIIDKNKPVYIYCKSGIRSSRASKILQKKGYKVINITGGYNAWKN